VPHSEALDKDFYEKMNYFFAECSRRHSAKNFKKN
jgi:hypothetical protein